MLSRFFIDRPIFAAVLSIFLVLAGLAAMKTLPIAQYPEIAPPMVTVRAIYPGASAAVLEQTVAEPLETQINGVEDMLYMSSTSGSNGMAEINVTFEIGTDVDQAAINVNNRVKQAETRLPQEVRRQGVTVEKSSASFLQIFAFYAEDGGFDDLSISNYVTLNVLDAIKRVPGTTNVQIFGAKDYAMRIWLRPDRMAQLQLTTDDLLRALNEQNAQFAAGKVGQAPTGGPQELVYTLTTRGRLSEPREFEDIIIRSNPDGSALRLKDVARVELGSKDYDFIGRFNGKEATLLGVFLQPGANALAVGKEVEATVKELSGRFPSGLTYAIPYDTTRFVEVSIREVVKTLAEAMTLVFFVVFLFLQNLRATLIPFAAVPVSLIGTFAGLFAMGYSINTLTLFGMVLAIGIVVDDAVVVMENVERIMREERMKAREAAIQAMREVTNPIVAIVLTLCAVFVPVTFLGGLTGELYRQFAVTIAMAVVISGLVALTLTPSLCAFLLKDEHRTPGRFFNRFTQGFQRVTGRYVDGVGWMIRRGAIGVALFLGMVGVTAWMWMTTPGSLVSEEDQGFYIAAVYLPDGATLQRTDRVVGQVVDAILSNPANEYTAAFTGFDFLGGGFRNSAATIFAAQRHWDEREVNTQQLVGDYFMKTGSIREGLVFAFGPPPIFGLGTAGGFEFYIQNRGDGGPQRTAQVMGEFLGAANQDPMLAGVQTLWRSNVPQLYVDVDREKAKALGVPLNHLFDTLAATLGSFYVNDFNRYGRTWQVVMSAEPGYRNRPDAIGELYVRSDKGDMIPVKALATVSYVTGPDSLDRFNNLPAVKFFGQAAPGVSSGQAIGVIEKIAQKVLPTDFSYDWGGASYQEKRSGGTAAIALGAAAVMVFLILAALYEKWGLPLSVMMALPFGTFGALTAIWIRGLTNDVYFQIGLITLLGLAAKNAILIVEYAVLKNREGLTPSAAAMEAARLRFRPILMTSLAFIFGVAPLAFSTGAGAGARISAGTGVMGGMLTATFLAIFFVPMFYKLITDRHLREGRPTAEIKAEIEHHKAMSRQAVAGFPPPSGHDGPR
ncbi:MAG: multidrug efflux RND transporter permease subunit [Nitrospirae bacterium]|nr:multidrug efflux RND transporter permease subunit [Nitrospirota bacterium]